MSRLSTVTSTALKAILPLVTVAASLGVAQWLIATKPEQKKQETEKPLPHVEVIRVQHCSVRFPLRSQGTVLPRTESTLVARVSGRIVSVADSFDESGFFLKDEMLVKIDRRDYEVRIRRLEASLNATHAQLGEAEKYLGRIDELRKTSAGTEVEYDRSKASYDVAVARSAELEAQLEEARNALSDTTMVAPYDGCIRQKHADLGQFVTTGTPLADCFATDAVEVRLPVDDQEFAFIGLPLGETLSEDSSPEVTLEADFGGRVCRWKGTIVRTEAFVDPRSRMVYLVAHVRDPYRKRDENNGQPLAIGMFVEAAVRCPPIDDTVLLPESCVSHDGRLFLIGPDGKLAQQQVEVIRREKSWVVVRGNLEEDQKICVTQLANPLEGMQVAIGETISLDPSRMDGSGLVDLSAGVQFAPLSDDGKAVGE